jgi:hypothetical protein
MLKDKILQKNKGLLFYGLTPPKINTEQQRIVELANKQIERIKDIDIDGLVLYDIQDESSRTDIPRPFPYMPTISPDDYSETYLKELNVPKIIYKSVGKYSVQEFKTWLETKEQTTECTVFVGSPSKDHMPALTLHDAYKIKQQINSSIVLGGVAIPERHVIKHDEHLRMYDKIDKGCNFFISQCVYNMDIAKNLLSDYYYTAHDSNKKLVPIIFTLTPCGSLKTLEFMKWLGIDMPNWLNNELKHSENILQKSLDICKKIAVELLEFSANKNIPIGFNIESVAVRKDEIEASIQLLKDVKELVK